MNRDYDSRDKINPYYVPLGNYYGHREIDTRVQYKSAQGVQIVPVFAGVNYTKPNYNSLVHGSCVNHAEAANAYIYNNCVTYKARYDGPEGTYYADSKGNTGYTGPTMAPTARPSMGPTMGPTMAPTARPIERYEWKKGAQLPK